MAIKVVKNDEKPEPTPVLAEAIIRIGAAADALRKSGLNEAAIVALLYDSTKVPKRMIYTVLKGLSQLRGWYCRS